MGLIDRLLGLVFSPPSALRETVEVFRENAEAAATRRAALSDAALSQFAAEFAAPRPGFFDRAMNGLNRLPRPLMALGTLALFGSAMADPHWFAERMRGIALVPDPLWWLLGAIVSFYFGARHQAKGQEFQASILHSLARAMPPAPPVATKARGAPRPQAGDEAPNAALEEWRRQHGR